MTDDRTCLSRINSAFESPVCWGFWETLWLHWRGARTSEQAGRGENGSRTGEERPTEGVEDFNTRLSSKKRTCPVSKRLLHVERSAAPRRTLCHSHSAARRWTAGLCWISGWEWDGLRRRWSESESRRNWKKAKKWLGESKGVVKSGHYQAHLNPHFVNNNDYRPRSQPPEWQAGARFPRCRCCLLECSVGTSLMLNLGILLMIFTRLR